MALSHSLLLLLTFFGEVPDFSPGSFSGSFISSADLLFRLNFCKCSVSELLCCCRPARSPGSSPGPGSWVRSCSPLTSRSCPPGFYAAASILEANSVYVVLGANVTLKTTLKKPPYLVILWNFNNGQSQVNVATLTKAEGLKVSQAYQGRASIDEDGSLFLDKTTSADSGDYDISVISTDGTATAATELKVLGESLQGSRDPERETWLPPTPTFFIVQCGATNSGFLSMFAPLWRSRATPASTLKRARWCLITFTSFLSRKSEFTATFDPKPGTHL